MTTAITKIQHCILLISGIEIWVTKEKAAILQNVLKEIEENKFIHFEGRTINTSSISAILLPEDMEAHTKRKNGYWQCKYQTWHEKGNKCECVNPERQIEREAFFKERGYWPL